MQNIYLPVRISWFETITHRFKFNNCVKLEFPWLERSRDPSWEVRSQRRAWSCPRRIAGLIYKSDGFNVTTSYNSAPHVQKVSVTKLPHEIPSRKENEVWVCMELGIYGYEWVCKVCMGMYRYIRYVWVYLIYNDAKRHFLSFLGHCAAAGREF